MSVVRFRPRPPNYSLTSTGYVLHVTRFALWRRPSPQMAGCSAVGLGRGRGQRRAICELQYAQWPASAKQAGLICAVAMPLYVDARIRAVVVLFCGNDLVDGYYGSMVDAFARDSRDTCLPRGSGLPGLALPCQVMKNENFVPTFVGTAINVYCPPGRKPGARRIPRCAEAGLYLRRG